MPGVREEFAKYPIDFRSREEMQRLLQLACLLTERTGLLPRQVTLSEGSQILDIGCGPGEWVLEVAREYPHCKVVGLDISREMTDYGRAVARVSNLKNTEFICHDATQKMPFAAESLQIVHVRLATSFLSVDSWPAFIDECSRILCPGGVLCSTELENMGFTTSNALARYNDLIVKVMRAGGRTFSDHGDNIGIIPKQMPLLRDRHFEQINQEVSVLNFSSDTPAHLMMVESHSTMMKLMQPSILKGKWIEEATLTNLYTQALAEMFAADFSAVLILQTVWGFKPS